MKIDTTKILSNLVKRTFFQDLWFLQANFNKDYNLNCQWNSDLLRRDNYKRLKNVYLYLCAVLKLWLFTINCKQSDYYATILASTQGLVIFPFLKSHPNNKWAKKYARCQVDVHFHPISPTKPLEIAWPTPTYQIFCKYVSHLRIRLSQDSTSKW